MIVFIKVTITEINNKNICARWYVYVYVGRKINYMYNYYFIFFYYFIVLNLFDQVFNKIFLDCCLQIFEYIKMYFHT